MMTTMEAVRDALAQCPTLLAAAAESPSVGSCKIGLEANIGPDDYPMIRIVPSRIIAGRPYHGRECETLIYFGAPFANSEGMETVYGELFQLEVEILAVLRGLGARYRETITDEDRLDAYKLMVIRVDITGANTAPAPAPAPPAPAPAPP